MSDKFFSLAWVVSFFLCVSFSTAISVDQSQLEQANFYYRQGKQATALLERKLAFNRALSLYLEIERSFAPICSSALYEAIAACYSHLEEPAWAILYYYRALSAAPFDQSIQSALISVQQTLQIPTAVPPTVWQKNFIV